MGCLSPRYTWCRRAAIIGFLFLLLLSETTFASISGNAKILWNTSYPYVDVPDALDINCNGTLDVVEANPGVVAFNGSDGSLLWEANLSNTVREVYVRCPYVVTLNENWTGGYYTVATLNPSNGYILWNKSFYYPYVAWDSSPRFLDIDGGAKDVVVVTFAEGGDVKNYTLVALNLSSGAEIWNSTIINATEIFYIQKIGELKRYGKPDFNNDGAEDLVVSYLDENFIDDYTLAISGKDGSIIWSQSKWIHSGASDVDGDDVIDLLGRYEMVSGRNGSIIYEFNATRSTYDLDGDYVEDIGDAIIDTTTEPSPQPVSAGLWFDADKDGTPERDDDYLLYNYIAYQKIGATVNITPYLKAVVPKKFAYVTDENGTTLKIRDSKWFVTEIDTVADSITIGMPQSWTLPESPDLTPGMNFTVEGKDIWVYNVSGYNVTLYISENGSLLNLVEIPDAYDYKQDPYGWLGNNFIGTLVVKAEYPMDTATLVYVHPDTYVTLSHGSLDALGYYDVRFTGVNVSNGDIIGEGNITMEFHGPTQSLQTGDVQTLQDTLYNITYDGQAIKIRAITRVKDRAPSKALDDVTGDGISDFASWCKACDDSTLRFRNGADASVVWSINISGADYAKLEVSDNNSKTGIIRAEASFLNETTWEYEYNWTKLIKLNLSDGTILWEWQLNGTRCKASTAGDLTGDGVYDMLCYYSYREDIIAYLLGRDSSYLAAINGANGTTIWEFVNRTIPLIGDFNGDGKGDVVLGMQELYPYAGNNITIASGDNLEELASIDPAGNITVGLLNRFLTTSPTLSNNERGVDFTGDGKADLPVVFNPEENTSEILLLTYSAPDVTPPNITFAALTPENGTVLNVNSMVVNITSNEALNSATFYLQQYKNGTWGMYNESGFFPGEWYFYPMQKVTDTNWFFNVTFSSDVRVRGWVEARDLAGNVNTTGTRYVTIAGFAPAIYVNLGGIAYVPQYTTQFNKLYLFINEGSPDILQVYRNGSFVASLIYPGFENFNISIDTSQVGVWNYTLVANDTFGNVNSTSLLITVTPAKASIEKNINGSPIFIDETYTNASVVLEILPEVNAGMLRLNASMSINVSELESNTSNEEFVYALASGQASLSKFVKVEEDARDINGGASSLQYAMVAVGYNSEDLDTNDDGNADVNESTLTLWRYCDANDTWIGLPHGSNYNITCGGENITVFASGVDTGNRFVWANLSHLSIFGIAGSLADSDGDGIPDINDACPTQAENINSYQDSDGCPDTKPSAPAGGGGGLPKNAVEIPKIKAGESYVAVFNEKYVPDIASIEIFAAMDQYYTRISVSTYKEKPRWVVFDDAPGKIYRYFKIRYSKPNTYITKAKITFRVNGTWLRDNDVDPASVVIYRLSESKEWEKLDTTPERAENGTIYYTAETPGFSWFAVSAKEDSGFRDIFAEEDKVKPAPTPAPTPAPEKPVQEEKPAVTTPPPETGPPAAKPKPEEKPEKRGICGPTIITAMAMLAVLLKRACGR